MLIESGTPDSFKASAGQTDNRLPKAAVSEPRIYLQFSLAGCPIIQSKFCPWYFHKMNPKEIPVLAEIILMNHKNHGMAGTCVSLPRIRNRDVAENPQQTTGLVKQLITDLIKV